MKQARGWHTRSVLRSKVSGEAGCSFMGLPEMPACSAWSWPISARFALRWRTLAAREP